jgi:16S rRNA (cytosine967-C5)-methyltransferase
MRTADHAAVNETVSLAPMRSRGFVNAILRNFIRKKDSLSFPDPQKDLSEYLSVAYSFPKETCSFFIERFGGKETEALLNAMNESASRPMTLRINTLKASSDELLSALSQAKIDAEPSKDLPYALKLSSGCSFYELERISEGGFFVQDEASQLAVAALDARPSQRVIDMCSCPGSKSFGAAIDMKNRGEILAFDISKSKLPLISSGAERLGINIIKTDLHDGRELIHELENSADRIICDVPCSGFGVISKKPEIRYKNISDTLALPSIQYDILCTASKYLKKGGYLVYSTCTILPEENQNNIKKFLLEHQEFKTVPFSVGKFSAPDGMITLMPHIHGTDGFFVCKLTKI